MSHHPDCDSLALGPNLEPSTKPCNCGADEVPIPALMSRIVKCAAGMHEPLIRPIQIGGEIEEPVRVSVQSRDHGVVHFAVCRYCRGFYMRRRDE